MFETHLQADGQVDPAAEGGADGSRVEPQVLEEFGEGLRQGRPGTLLSYDHTGPHPGQVQPSRLKGRRETQGEKQRCYQIILCVCGFLFLKCSEHTERLFYLQRVGLQAEAFGAELHDAVGAESVSDFELTDGRQPESRIHLQLRRRDQDGLVT